MLFIIKKASDWEYSEYKEIDTLEELMSFMETTGYDIIVEQADARKSLPTITIYDYYVE